MDYIGTPDSGSSTNEAPQRHAGSQRPAGLQGPAESQGAAGP